MSVSGLDLNLVHRAVAGRGGPAVIVAPDAICGSGVVTATSPAGHLPWRPLLAAPGKNFVPMEGDPSRPPVPAGRSDYGRRLAKQTGARIDLTC